MKEIIDISIAAATLMSCFFIVVSMLFWVYALRNEFLRSPIVWMFLSIFFAKIAIGDWAQVNLLAMWEGNFPPFYTLRPRILLMISVIIQIVAIVVIWRRHRHLRGIRR